MAPGTIIWTISSYLRRREGERESGVGTVEAAEEEEMGVGFVDMVMVVVREKEVYLRDGK
jgi:hypothetical protein